MKLYLVKKGEDVFEYKFVSDKLSLVELNNNPILSDYPKLNNNDHQMITNSGGTVVKSILRGANNWEILWLVNIEHKQDKKVGVILGEDLVSIIRGIIDSIKRDLKISSILLSYENL